MKVLVGVDGSSNSFAAVRFVGRLLSPERDELVLIYATPEAAFLSDELLEDSVLARAQAALSRAVFDEAISRLPPAWQAKLTEAAQVHDDAAPSMALLDAIDKHHANMIAVGFRGTSLFERYVLGSVSRTIVYSATVPVLVVKSEPSSDARAEQPAGEAKPPFQVLIAYDGPEFGERIARVANQIAWPEGTVGTVMTVVRPMHLTELPDWLQTKTRDPDVAAMAEAWRKEHEQSVQAARDELKSIQQTLPACFAQREPIVAEGRPADKLLDELNKAPYDLVMMGSRGSGPFHEILIGSTSAQVLSRGPCSVLIVR
jgi:nucleotide-binding universal stress UspA family protein